MLVTDDFIHRPWEAPPLLLAEAGVALGKDYPLPIVDHAERREAALAMYALVKAQRAAETARSPRRPRSRPGHAREP